MLSQSSSWQTPRRLCSHPPEPPTSTDHPGDVTKREAWEAALAATEKAFGGVNFIINNAGATYKSKPVLETTERDFDLCMDVNLKSVFHSVHVMIPAIRRTREAGGPAAFINVSSTAGIAGRPGLTWYCGSKAACISVTKNLSIEFGPEQIVSSEQRRERMETCVESRVRADHLSALTPSAPSWATRASSTCSSASSPRRPSSRPFLSAAAPSPRVSSESVERFQRVS